MLEERTRYCGSLMRHRTKNFLHHLYHSKKGEEDKDSLQKVKALSPTAQRQASVTGAAVPHGLMGDAEEVLKGRHHLLRVVHQS